MAQSEWQQVVSLHDCEFEEWDTDQEMAICPICKTDYGECPCPGPTQEDEYEYRETSTGLQARKLKSDEHPSK